MAREKGYVMSPESKALCREGAALSWAPDSERRAFLDFKTSVGRAVRAGDAEEAHALIDRYMAGMPQDEEDQD